MPLAAIAVLAAGTFALRSAGPLLRTRLRLPRQLRAVLDDGAIVLLFALAVTGAATAGHGFAGWARLGGDLTAAALVLLRMPLPVVVVVAGTVTALLRLGGL